MTIFYHDGVEELMTMLVQMMIMMLVMMLVQMLMMMLFQLVMMMLFQLLMVMLAAQLVIMSQSIKFSAMCKMTSLQSKCSLRETTTIFAAIYI